MALRYPPGRSTILDILALASKPLPIRQGPGRLYDPDDRDHRRPLIPLFLAPGDAYPVGLLAEEIVEAIKDDSGDQLSRGVHPPLGCVLDEEDEVQAVIFVCGDSTAARSEALARLLQSWRRTGRFKDLLNWRNEDIAVFAHPGHRDNVAFYIDRSAQYLFGCVGALVYVLGYSVDRHGNFHIWAGTRSEKKAWYAGWLDSIAAGGIVDTDSPLSSAIRECHEEASLPPRFTASRLKATDALSTASRDKHGKHLAFIAYCFELKLDHPDDQPNCIKPFPGDGEVDRYELLSESEALAH